MLGIGLCHTGRLPDVNVEPMSKHRILRIASSTRGTHLLRPTVDGQTKAISPSYTAYP
jgi:hypothetical protein